MPIAHGSSKGIRGHVSAAPHLTGPGGTGRAEGAVGDCGPAVNCLNKTENFFILLETNLNTRKFVALGMLSKPCTHDSKQGGKYLVWMQMKNIGIRKEACEVLVVLQCSDEKM